MQKERKNKKLKRKQRDTSPSEMLSVPFSGDANLTEFALWKHKPVGFSGKVTTKKLRPLRRSRSDKIRESKLERDRQEKYDRLERQIAYHKNLLDRMKEIATFGQLSDNNLYEELQEMYENSRKCLLFFLQDSPPALPSDIEEMFEEILREDPFLENVILLKHLNRPDNTDNLSLDNSPQTSSKCKSGKVTIPKVLNENSVKKDAGFQNTSKSQHQNLSPTNSSRCWQVFIRSSLNSSFVTMRVSPSEPGEAIFKTVRKLIPNAANSILLYQGQKVDLNRGIAEQGIQNEANIDLHFSLLGGANESQSESKNQDRPSSFRNKDPTAWNKTEVAVWVDKVSATYEIAEKDVVKLKLLNGAGLQRLKKEDWIGRSPNQGDLFYDLWVELCGRKEQVTTMPSAAAVNQQQTSVRDVGGKTTEIEGLALSSEDTELDCSMAASCSKSTVCGPFGISGDLSNVDSDARSVDDIAQINPCIGDVVSVKGFCSSRPQNRGSAGSLLLRNDPSQNEDFLELKIDIRAHSSSTLLTKHKVGTFLNLKLGEPVLIRGRVESLDRGFSSKKKGFVMLCFKLVVDSDSHAAVRQERKENHSFARQMSTPWPEAYGLFPAEVSTNQPLCKGEVLKQEHGVLWCEANDSMETTLKKQVVALKNCMTGDVFIGVSENGKIVGFSVSKHNLIQKRESIVKAVGSILPSVDNKVAVCDSAEAANDFTIKDKTFVAFMWLPEKDRDCGFQMQEDENIDIVVRIHVTKGEMPLHFVKQSDTHAYKRVGTETKCVSDYAELFHDLESLACRKIPSRPESSVPNEMVEANRRESKPRIFQKISKRYETDTQEFKVIYGDPTKHILRDYVAKYTASFLNSSGGTIYFGVDEDRKSKQGCITGIVLTDEERRKLWEESCKIIRNFWPSVQRDQFKVEFSGIRCDIEKYAVKFPKTFVDCREKFVGIVTAEEKISSVENFVRSKLNKKAAVVRLSQNQYALLLETSVGINTEELLADLKSMSAKQRFFEIENVEAKKLKDTLDNLCVASITANESPYPIHLTQLLTTYLVDKDGKLREMNDNEVLKRFRPVDTKFDFETFLHFMNELEKENTSYILITSPHSLSKKECDLYGLVIPEWSMVIDFDQNPKEEGHLFDTFQKCHDKHQPERNLFIKTPMDRKLELNPANGICWCAVRGFEENAESMSEGDHAVWMMKHGKRIGQHLSDELVPQIAPNSLRVLCLWEHGHNDLIHSVDYLLRHIFSLWGPTKIAFVCSNNQTKEFLGVELIDRLTKAGYSEKVSVDGAFVASPQQLSRFLATRMPEPYRPEYSFQIPKKFYFKEGERTMPETLPQNLRQLMKGQLEFFYFDKFVNPSSDDLEKARAELYSGSEIRPEGLAGDIAIERGKMKELKNELKAMLSDRKSHVGMIIIKSERGAGATTLCLQLLYDRHKLFPCARLLEFHKSLVSNIEKVNSLTKLPLILFVDAELAVLPEFAAFKSEAERRNVNLMLIVVESDVILSGNTPKKHGKPPKATPFPYLIGSAPYKTVDLRRELSVDEVSLLVQQLLKINCVSEETRHKLQDLEKRAKSDCSGRKFALFSLAVFGRKFVGLEPYVKYRLNQADEVQIEILELLALVHIYTDYHFPVNALAKHLQKTTVILENIFLKDVVRELLSPRSKDKNERRISFLEVAEEILKQRAKCLKMFFPRYLKTVAVRVAKTALAVSQPSKLLDRITRRLYVTSEYSSEKFSPLVRFIKEEDEDASRDMLLELCNVFEEESSVWAHLMAHLAKYYMTIYGDFDAAIPKIEEAVKSHTEDSLLHHIHGDIIRLHIKHLKEEKDVMIDDILRFAIESSACFQIVREKRPLMEYGYTSDALVRKIVMLAAIKKFDREHYVDCLKEYLEIIKCTEEPQELHINYKFVLSLIPDAFEYLTAVPMNKHTEQLKKILLDNIGSLEELKEFCDNLKQVMKGTTNESWTDEAVRKTTTLIYALEMETRDLTQEEADERIAKMEELSRGQYDEQSMKLWIRCVRPASKVPDLKKVRKKINFWLKESKRKSPNALFYNYVVAVLEALSDSQDTEKMQRARTCIDEMRRKKNVRWKGTIEDPNLPVEWLHPKNGRHINSIDSLLHHDDLVKGFNKRSKYGEQTKVRKEIIEKALFEQQITKWQGIVSEIINDWKGYICLKKYITVPFIPLNVIPSLPSQGENVEFCLAFQRNGPMAWSVVCRRDLAKASKADRLNAVIPKAEQIESSEEDEDDSHDLQPLVSKPLHRQTISQDCVSKKEPVWEDYVGEDKFGVVDGIMENKGFGLLLHPAISDKLFFHAMQFFPPIEDISTVSKNTVLSFTVGSTERGIRAMNIKLLDERDKCTDQEVLGFLKEREVEHQTTSRGKEKQENESKSLVGSRQIGVVKKVIHKPNGRIYGFINVTGLENVTVHFDEHYSGVDRRSVGNITKGTKVQFTIDTGKENKGYTAKDLCIQRETKNSCSCGWEEFIGKGIQEGLISDLKTSGYGFIEGPTSHVRPRRLYFRQSSLCNIPFRQLRKGDKVHFQVVTGTRGCAAADVQVIRTQALNFQQQAAFTPWPTGYAVPPPPTCNYYSPLMTSPPRWQRPSGSESDKNARGGWKTVQGRKR